MAHGLQGADGLGWKAAFFEQGRPVERTEIGQIGGLLHRQAPVQRREHQHTGLADDEGAAGAPGGHGKPAGLLLEHEGRRHRRQRPFAGLHPVGDGRAIGVARGKAEVGQLVVQQKAMHHLARAEGRFNRRGQGQRIASGIDDADVGGAVFDLPRHRRITGFEASGLAGAGDLHALCAGALGDQRCARGQIGGIEQAHPAASGRFDKIRVAQVQVSVGKHQARRFGIQVQPGGRRQPFFQRQLGRRCVAEHAQNLPDRDGACAGRRKAANLKIPGVCRVGLADGRAFFCLVSAQVGQSQQAGVAGVLAHLVHHGLRQFALVQGIGALAGDLLKDGCQGGVAQDVPGRMRIAISLIEISPGRRILAQIGIGFQQSVQAGADLEAILGQVDRWREQLRPRQPAMLAVGHLQHAQCAGHTHGAAAHGGLAERHRLAVSAQKQRGRRSHGRGLAAIKSVDLFAVEVQQERAAAKPAALRLHQAQDHLHGNGRVDRAAAGLDDLVARLRGQWIGRGHGKSGCRPTGFVGVAAGALGPHLRDIADVRWGGRRGATSQRGECCERQRRGPNGEFGFHECYINNS